MGLCFAYDHLVGLEEQAQEPGHQTPAHALTKLLLLVSPEDKF